MSTRTLRWWMTLLSFLMCLMTIPGFFTDIMAQEIGEQLGRKVTVYFKFKPTPQLWVQDHIA